MTHPGPHCEGCAEYVPPPPAPPRVKAVSTTWPWDHGKMAPLQVVQHLLALRATEVCIRAPVYYTPVDPKHLAPQAQAFHDELVGLAMDADLDVTLWPIVSLFNPELMADRIAEWAEHYDPDRIYLDAERHWVKGYIQNLGRFLDRLAKHKRDGRIRCPVGLGSYRRANYHADMRWREWYGHKPGGVYTIDFLAHQLYPIGWNAVAAYGAQTLLDIRSHDDEVARTPRAPMDWIPWMPAFAESGWVASAAGVREMVARLESALGERLIGMNWWSLDQYLVLRGEVVDPRFRDLYLYIGSTR